MTVTVAMLSANTGRWLARRVGATGRNGLGENASQVNTERIEDAAGAVLRRRMGTIDALVDAARADRIYAFMRPYLEALV